MKKSSNYIKLEFLSRSINEGFARSAVAAFASQLDPTLDELRLYPDRISFDPYEFTFW